MGAYAGPDISESGLVLALDAGNQKSLNIPTQADHGYAEWYCLVSGTATYSIINSTGGIIYENNAGTITTLVTATTPQRGTISVTAGRKYYGSVPINLVVEDQQHSIVPLTMIGTQFWNIAVRNNPSTYYVYSPYQAATVNFYDNTVGGLTATPTSTLSLSAGQSGTFTSNNLTNHWISSNVPILASVTQTGADKTILSPMSTYVYRRYQNNLNTTNNTTPTNNNEYVTYDSTYKVMNMNIADGAGGDCAQGLGLEYLSDTYSWGNVVSDYTIVFPYTATVTASYWNGSAWVVWDTHSNIAGSITNPPRVMRDGTNGPGVEASAIQGAAANMASGATLWKWEGTAPFYICINDSADDEFSVLGWLSARNTTPRSSNVIIDISGIGNNGTLTNGPTYSINNGGSLVFDGSNDYVSVSNTSQLRPSTELSIGMWIKANSITAGWVRLFGQDPYTGGPLIFLETGGSLIRALHYPNGVEVRCNTDYSISTTQYTYVVFTFKTGDAIRSYFNGVANTTAALSAGTFSYNTSNPYLIGHSGVSWFNGNISNISYYDRALTAAEVQQNFNATRSRFGI